MAERLALLFLLPSLALSSLAHAEREDPTESLNAERDALIDKLVRGVEVEASVQRFQALVKQRDAVVATSLAAKEREREARDKQRATDDTRRAWRDEYHKTNDYEVSWRCTLSPDPAHPIPSTEGRFTPDWGKVVRKEHVRLAPKNELDEGEPATLYEVAGITGLQQFRGEKFSAFRDRPFEAAVGDLVLICRSGDSTLHGLPAGWGPKITTGFGARVQAPPLIVKKTRWNPIHVTGSTFFWAIKDVKWKFPPGSFLLSNIEIGKDLGGGCWEISADRDLSWILEVPPGVKNQALLQPGHAVWVILGQPRFDRGLKKLVLQAEDLEARYVLEK